MPNSPASRSPATFSIVLPTRGRVEFVHRLFDSMLETAERPDRLEVILYLDRDDRPSHALEHPGLELVKLIRRPEKMSRMVRQCIQAAGGRLVMLMNDDVIYRTPGWDRRIDQACQRFADGIGMVWCNDLFRGPAMPNFPVLPRTVCREEGIFPGDYHRDYVDTHLFDVFKKLQALGHDRLAYLPDVIVEHLHVEAGKAEFDGTYVKPRQADDELAYIAWEPQRRVIAERLARAIEGGAACAS